MAIEEKIVGETPEQIFKSLQTDISLFELELLLDWYEQLSQAHSGKGAQNGTAPAVDKLGYR